jgi:peroxiredoxin
VRKKILIIFLLAGLLVWAIYNYQAKQNTIKLTEEKVSLYTKIGIQKGQRAPDFELQTVEGEKAKLSYFMGKKVILNFWATWCPPCKAEMPNMEEFHHENKNVIILSVNLTSNETKQQDVQNFIKQYGLTFPVLLDKEGMAGNLYQAITIPTSYIIDTKGVIQQKIVGPMSKETMENITANLE